MLDLAERSNKLWPADRGAQAQVGSWVIAALNSVEPYLSNVAEVDFFTDDETLRRLRSPGAVAAARQRLGKLSAFFGAQTYLVGDAFTAADLMKARPPTDRSPFPPSQALPSSARAKLPRLAEPPANVLPSRGD